MDIRIVSEGVTDQEVITSILQSFTEDKNLEPTRLLPVDSLKPVGWDNVIDYCGSDEFKGAFPFLDFVVVQVDTDRLRTGDVRAEWRIPHFETKTTEETVELVREKLIATISEDFYTAHAHQIIFAIAVSEIECWFLGLYLDAKKAAKTENCIKLLNTVAKEKTGYYIGEQKPLEMYRKMCREFRKKADLEKHSQHNPSFRLFLNELRTKLGDQPLAQPV